MGDCNVKLAWSGHPGLKCLPESSSVLSDMGFEALCLTWTAPAAEPAHPQPLTASVRPPRPGSASQGPCPNKKVRFGIRGFLVLGMDSDGVRSVAGRSFSGPNGFCGRNFRACVDKRSRRGFGGSRSLTGAGYSKLTGPSGDRTISVIESPPVGCISPKAGRPAMTPRYCVSIQLTCWSLQGCRGLLDLSMPPPGVALSPRCPRIALAHKENPLNDPDLLLKRTPERKSLTSRST